MKRMTIYVDGSQNDAQSLTTAARFCERLGGRLRAIHPREPDQIVVPGGGTPSVVDNAASAEASARRSKAAYDQVCSALDFATWEEAHESLPVAIVQNCLLNDVTILERIAEEEGPEAEAFNTALFDTSAPVLVTPPNAPDTVGKSAAVMWSATVQSACAIRSALPVLQQADDVWILTNRDNPKADPAALADYLGDYGVKAEAHSFTGAKQTGRGRGRAMLAALKELPADLLIMGAYGENRLSAIFGLGRATRKVVTASPIPLLIQR